MKSIITFIKESRKKMAYHRKTWPLKDFENLATALGLGAKVFKRVIDKFIKSPDLVFDMIDRSFLSEKYKEQYKKIWLERTARLQKY